MLINIPKSKVMRITKRKCTTPTYFLCNSELESVYSFKYLGIIFTSNLSWDMHISAITTRASRLLGFLRSISAGLSVAVKLNLYKSLILPIIEYGVPAWGPQNQCQVNKLESIQRHATRYILGVKRQEVPYHNRLKQLNWYSISYRYKIILINFITKCMIGNFNCTQVTSHIIVNVRHADTLLFNHIFARTDILRTHPINIFPRLWSELPAVLRDSLVCDSIQTFLSKVKRYFLPLSHNEPGK